MKTVSVNVVIQMDIKSNGDDVNQVLNVIEQANDYLRMQFPDQQPQIMSSSIDQSDITDFFI